VDDCLDLVGVEQTVGKSLGSDLRNGELTLPLIHLLSNTTGARKQELLSVFATYGGGPPRDVVRPALERSGSVDYALRLARSEIQCARDEIGFLPDSAAKRALMEMPDYILGRQS
jgi:octaprenyl-diphosphate synthase